MSPNVALIKKGTNFGGGGGGYITQGHPDPKSNLQFLEGAWGGDNWSAMYLSHLHGV